MPIVLDYTIERRPLEVATILNRCGLLLLDEEMVRWTEAELITWINEGVGEIINLKPAAGSKSVVHTLTGGTFQALPEAVVQLIDIDHNVAADGSAGRAITLTDKALMDAADPDWHRAKPKVEVRHYMYDDRVPGAFYVYPPAIANAKVRLSYAVVPEDVENPEDTIGINSEFTAALVNYVMSRAKSKDSEFANAAEANAYYQAFMGAMGAEAQGAQTNSPNGAKP